jgi:beta-lactamase superfamily II metal-dependent hydrolase
MALQTVLASHPHSNHQGLLAIAIAAAAALPSLLAYNLAPSPTYLNQALAFTLWALFVMASAPARPGRGPWAALALLAATAPSMRREGG